MSRYRDQRNYNNEPSETNLIHEYINLMDTTVRTQSEISEEIDIIKETIKEFQK